MLDLRRSERYKHSIHLAIELLLKRHFSLGLLKERLQISLVVEACLELLLRLLKLFFE